MTRSWLATFNWRRLPPVVFMMLLCCCRAHAADQYFLDQTTTSIDFSVSHLGLFSSHGEFRRFSARLQIDPTHPALTKIIVDVDAGSVAMPWQAATVMLRSPDFFDVQRYPEIRFTTTTVEPVTPEQYLMRGVLEMHGAKGPLVLRVKLVGRHGDSTGRDVAEFIATGTLRRSEFGMIADSAFISDRIAITVDARIALGQASHAG